MSKQQDAMAIIELYKLRCEPLMRDARKWYSTEFSPQGAADIVALMTGGHTESAFYRMTTSYWDMAGSLVLNGGIDEKMFLDANGEHLFIYAKIAPYLDEVRAVFNEPGYLRNFEELVKRTPDHEAKIESRKRLAAMWHRAGK